ncbi:RagB/SusD family nutrient uptake outer membrane protein [Chitinophaga sp. Cy-1792]|uniref:RagB/SusD family nutrient uptake outer membrane protein n=1 Tax=Chitinophaga sp. Cy-1792 TaxID=2608339 RepID=UPI00141F8FD4|nr:RagB/SusD family nutrient uptake outer membrane protein [Chitinophaga sp. Cy-1792]NIG55845.1 RagB/SusD family nutrient uptake outer membrane protein [Chitinophaga sp. Cy-1792]
MKRTAFNIIGSGILLSGLLLAGCNKMLDIKDPINSITTNQVFQSDEQASIALNGLYSYLINGGVNESNSEDMLGADLYSAGGITVAAAHSADELYHPALGGDYLYYVETTNKITLQNLGYSTKIWRSAFKGVFNANALIQGTRAATSKQYTPEYRKRVLGEALAVRAMSFFYLVNIFEKIPLALSIDHNDTQGLPSATPAAVYQQIINDLEEASGYLSENYEGNNVERIRINKWYVEAMLARVYLYTKDYEKAWQHANAVIGRTDLFQLEPLNNVFTIASKEVIFQLKQNNTMITRGNATPEEFVLSNRYLTPMLLNAFETGDNRKTAWTLPVDGGLPGSFAAKYKINRSNFAFNGYRSEYYVVMRLAEMYLVRAEANMLRNAANKNATIDDLNTIRRRAGLNDLPYTLTDQQTIDAIAQERRIELFAEWGHRWMDLKRTNKATDILGAISYKQPWSAHELLYPIPPEEIRYANNLSQNEGY